MQQETGSDASIPIAAGLAGAGGLLVFGAVGIGAFRLLGGSEEDEPAEGEQSVETPPEVQIS